MIVVDASTLVLALADHGAEGHKARDRLRGDPDLHMPHLVDLEVMSALRRLNQAGEIQQEQAEAALGVLSDLPLVRYPHLPLAFRIWELRANLTPYDASYVALAETLACPFVTSDRKIERASGIRCAVEIL